MVAVGWEKEGMVFAKIQLNNTKITLKRVLKFNTIFIVILFKQTFF